MAFSGAIRVDRLSDFSERFDALWQLLCASPVGKDVAHRKAIKFAYDMPPPHWFTLPVGTSVAPFELDSDALLQAAQVWTRHEIASTRVLWTASEQVVRPLRARTRSSRLPSQRTVRAAQRNFPLGLSIAIPGPLQSLESSCNCNG